MSGEKRLDYIFLNIVEFLKLGIHVLKLNTYIKFSNLPTIGKQVSDSQNVNRHFRDMNIFTFIFIVTFNLFTLIFEKKIKC